MKIKLLKMWDRIVEVFTRKEKRMNLSQMGWVLLIIGNVYTANDKGSFALPYIIAGLICFIADIFID